MQETLRQNLHTTEYSSAISMNTEMYANNSSLKGNQCTVVRLTKMESSISVIICHNVLTEIDIHGNVISGFVQKVRKIPIHTGNSFLSLHRPI